MTLWLHKDFKIWKKKHTKINNSFTDQEKWADNMQWCHKRDNPNGQIKHKKKDAAFQSNRELKIKTKKDTFLTH